ncbi:MAG: tyrosine-type recombinase/integrase, partial [Vicinamibacteria bacterium]
VATVPTTKARTWVRLGDAKNLSLDDARKAAKVEAGKVALGLDPNEERRKTRREEELAKQQTERLSAEPTVADLLRRHVEAREDKLSAVTRKEYLRTLAVDIESSALGRMKAKEVLRSHVRDFHATRGRHGKHQADRALVLLRAAYRWGQDEEVAPDMPLVDRDPTRGVEPFVKGSAKVRTRSLINANAKADGDIWRDVAAFWSGTEALRPVARTFVRLLLLVGLRRGEAAAALWKDVDIDGDPPVWHVPAEVRKGRVKGSVGERQALDVPLPSFAPRILRDLRAIPGTGERVFPHLWLGGVGAAVKAATGLPDIRLHDLRRSTASALQRLGAPPHVISTVLGHVERGGADSDAHYRHGGRFEEHRLWLERWATHVERLVSNGERKAEVVPIAGVRRA